MTISIELEAILKPLRLSAREKQGNSAWSAGGCNMGDDMLSAINCAEKLCRDALHTDVDLNPAQLAGLVREHIPQYEQQHYDTEGFGAGTLVDIANALTTTDTAS